MADAQWLTMDVMPEGFYLGAWRAISVVVFAMQADANIAKRVFAAGAKLDERHSKRASVSFILPGVPPPNEDARAIFQRYYLGSSAVTCLAVLVEGEGFGASAQRASSASMSTMGRGRIAVKQSASIEEVAPWLAQEHRERNGEFVAQGVLVDALNTVRYEIAPGLLWPTREISSGG